MQYKLTLDYTLAPGWMRPYVDGLKTGQALARHCTACKETSFPPMRVCRCGDTQLDWVVLSGRAQVLFRTEGIDGAFALVQFDGADTRSVVSLDRFMPNTHHGHLAPSTGDVPRLCLHPITEAEPT